MKGPQPAERQGGANAVQFGDYSPPLVPRVDRSRQRGCSPGPSDQDVLYQGDVLFDLSKFPCLEIAVTGDIRAMS